MVELIEDCLHIIFGHLTPVEWIQISEVCQLWRRVVLRQWRNVVNMEIKSDVGIGRLEYFRSVVVPADNAKKLLRYAAKFCNNLRVSSPIPNDREGCRIMFQRPFLYKVENLNVKDAVQIFAENATELKKVDFIELSETNCIEKLLERNKIRKVEICDTVDFWRNSRTDGIEILDIGFELDYEENYNFQSFEGHFQNLQTLRLRLYSEWIFNVEEFLSQTLSYVCGIKSLSLFVTSVHRPTIPMKDVVKCSQLEELSMEFEWKERNEDEEYLMCPDFDEQHQISSCSKLRNVTLKNFHIRDDNLRSLLLLPNLEKLNVGRSAEAFQLMKPLPEVKKLTDFVITFDPWIYADVERFCNAVKMMTKLQNLEVRDVCEDDKLELACKVITMAASQGKDIILQECRRNDDYNFDDVEKIDQLKIESRRKERNAVQILILGFDNLSEIFVDDVMTFVKEKLTSHRAYKLDDDWATTNFLL